MLCGEKFRFTSATSVYDSVISAYGKQCFQNVFNVKKLFGRYLKQKKERILNIIEFFSLLLSHRSLILLLLWPEVELIPGISDPDFPG